MDRNDITAEGLRVGIGFPSAVLLVMGGIIGVGIFVNPAVVARGLTSPLLVLAAWGAGGLIALLGAFVYAELAARMPSTGGYEAPFHPWTTGLFVLACLSIVGVSFWAYPVNSLVGYGIAALGIPPYLYWRAQARRTAKAS